MDKRGFFGIVKDIFYSNALDENEGHLRSMSQNLSPVILQLNNKTLLSPTKTPIYNSVGINSSPRSPSPASNLLSHPSNYRHNTNPSQINKNPLLEERKVSSLKDIESSSTADKNGRNLCALEITDKLLFSMDNDNLILNDIEDELDGFTPIDTYVESKDMPTKYNNSMRITKLRSCYNIDIGRAISNCYGDYLKKIGNNFRNLEMEFQQQYQAITINGGFEELISLLVNLTSIKEELRSGNLIYRSDCLVSEMSVYLDHYFELLEVNENLLRDIDQYKLRYSYMHKKNKSSSKENDSLTKDIKLVKEAQKSLTDTNKNLKEENDLLKGRMESLKQKQEKEIQELKKENKRLLTINVGLTKELDEIKRDKGKLEGNLLKEKNKNTLLKNELASIANDNNDLKSSLQNLEGNIEESLTEEALKVRFISLSPENYNTLDVECIDRQDLVSLRNLLKVLTLTLEIPFSKLQTTIPLLAIRLYHENTSLLSFCNTLHMHLYGKPLAIKIIGDGHMQIILRHATYMKYSILLSPYWKQCSIKLHLKFECYESFN
ncbi:Septation initiation [Nakaseomyces glabratus]